MTRGSSSVGRRCVTVVGVGVAEEGTVVFGDGVGLGLGGAALGAQVLGEGQSLAASDGAHADQILAGCLSGFKPLHRMSRPHAVRQRGRSRWPFLVYPSPKRTLIRG